MNAHSRGKEEFRRHCLKSVILFSSYVLAIFKNKVYFKMQVSKKFRKSISFMGVFSQTNVLNIYSCHTLYISTYPTQSERHQICLQMDFRNFWGSRERDRFQQNYSQTPIDQRMI